MAKRRRKRPLVRSVQDRKIILQFILKSRMGNCRVDFMVHSRDQVGLL